MTENKNKLTQECIDDPNNFRNSLGFPDKEDINNICPDTEMTGYIGYINNGEVKTEAWTEEYGSKDFKKYVSDPTAISTTGDGIADVVKIFFSEYDKGILEEAKHPMVAAYPSIVAKLENLVISKKIDITFKEGQEITDFQHNSVGNDKSNEIVTSEEFQLGINLGKPFKADAKKSNAPNGTKNSDAFASAHIEVSNTKSHSTTIEHTTESQGGQKITNSLGKSLEINEADTAYLNCNLRYSNIGTAPVYNAKPTINFVLGKENGVGDTLATITAKINSIANTILPSDYFPEENFAPVTLNYGDKFSLHNILLNYDQLKKLDQKYPLTIEVFQLIGDLVNIKSVTYAGDLGVEVDDARQIFTPYHVSSFINKIDSRTATLLIIYDKSKKMIERKVAARKESDLSNRYGIPILTIGEAIELAFKGTKLINKNGYFGFKYKNKEFLLHKNTDLVFMGDSTTNYFEKLDTDNVTNIFDCTLVQGLNIAFKEK